MQITRIRTHKGAMSTTGSFAIVGTSHSWVALEDKDRGLVKTMPLSQIEAIKVKNQTAIPTGTYEVIIDFSNRFQKDMPLILDVPGFAGIRIHSGNTDVDTDGCILMGSDIVNDDFVSGSRLAFAQFFPMLQQAICNKEKVYITIQ